MQYHESILEDDEVFSFVTVSFDPLHSENDDLSHLLATPIAPQPAHDTTRIESPGFNTYECTGFIETPGAPQLKDLDSFTEGTGAGSFADVLDEDDVNELALGVLVSHPEPCNSNNSIRAWIEDVAITHQLPDHSAESNAPWVGFADLPEDSFHTEILEATEAQLENCAINVEVDGSGDVDGDVDDEGDVNVNVSVDDSVVPRIPSPSKLVPPMSAPLTAMTPRVMKRARSRSPASQSSRRVCSRSLSSINALPRDPIPTPPWRPHCPYKNKDK